MLQTLKHNAVHAIADRINRGAHNMFASLVTTGIDVLIYTFAAVAIAGPIALFVAILRA